MEWSEYVRRVVGSDRQTDVARKTGIDQTTISRWLRPSAGGSTRISTANVAKFARGYDQDVLHAFVVAGFLTPEEAGVGASATDVALIDDDVLIAEMRRRMGRAAG